MDREDAILEYLQGRIGAADRQRFEAEMNADPSLAAEVDVMRQVRAALADAPEHDRADAVWDRLSPQLQAAPPAANDNRQPVLQVLRYAAVAAIAVAAWHFTVLPRHATAPTDFRPASETAASVMLQVRFAPATTIADIRSFLGDAGGTITDGPSALGLVHLSFPDADARARALATLQDRPELVDLVVTP